MTKAMVGNKYTKSQFKAKLLRPASDASWAFVILPKRW